jgi:hypothetical protein
VTRPVVMMCNGVGMEWAWSGRGLRMVCAWSAHGLCTYSAAARLLTRPMAITQPGMFLSQPGMARLAS